MDKTDLEIKIDYTTIPPNDDLGTADSLKLIQDKIKSDVVVVSCDFVSDVKLKGVLDLFRKHDASVVSLLLKQGKSEQIVVPGPKTKYKPGITSQFLFKHALLINFVFFFRKRFNWN